MDIVKKGIQELPQQAGMHELYGDVVFAQENYEESLVHYERANTITPNERYNKKRSRSYMFWASQLFVRNEFETSWDRMEQAYVPNSPFVEKYFAKKQEQKSSLCSWYQENQSRMGETNAYKLLCP